MKKKMNLYFDIRMFERYKSVKCILNELNIKIKKMYIPFARYFEKDFPELIYRKYRNDESILNNIEKSCFIKGSWENEVYFIDIREKLLKEIEIAKYREENIKLIKEMRMKNSVSIHIPYNDYVLNKNNTK